MDYKTLKKTLSETILRKLYIDKQKSAIQIAKKYKCNPIKIYQLLTLYKIKRRCTSEALILSYKNNHHSKDNGGNTQRNKYLKISKTRLYYLYKKKCFKLYEIAKQYNTSEPTISNLLKRYDIDISKRFKEKNSNWKNGILYDEKRKMILSPNHPYKNKMGYVYEYRLVMEKYLHKTNPNHILLIEINGKKYLRKECIIHHINRDETDNRIENLQLCKNQSAHTKIHGFGHHNRWCKNG